MDKEDPFLPTRHPPGSPGKLAILEARAALGIDLFNPDDAVDCRRRRNGGLSTSEARRRRERRERLRALADQMGVCLATVLKRVKQGLLSY